MMCGVSGGDGRRRQTGQGTAEEMRGKDLRKELEEREAEHLKAIGKSQPTSKRLPPPPPSCAPPLAARAARSISPPSAVCSRVLTATAPPVDDDDDDEGDAPIVDPDDADDKLAGARGAAAASAAAADASDDDSDDDSDDETEELMRELERIKKERAQAALREEREAAETDAKERDSAILQGNPLLDPSRLGMGGDGGGSFAVKRRCAALLPRDPAPALPTSRTYLLSQVG